jgi:hypothetical protein
MDRNEVLLVTGECLGIHKEKLFRVAKNIDFAEGSSFDMVYWGVDVAEELISKNPEITRTDVVRHFIHRIEELKNA